MDNMNVDLDQKDLKSFKRAFDIFDKDKSGKINFRELELLITELSQQSPSKDEVKQVDTTAINWIFQIISKILKEFDKDRSGKVEFKEFVRIMSKRAREEKKMKTQKEFEDAFKASALVQMYFCL